MERKGFGLSFSLPFIHLVLVSNVFIRIFSMTERIAGNQI